MCGAVAVGIKKQAGGGVRGGYKMFRAGSGGLLKPEDKSWCDVRFLGGGDGPSPSQFRDLCSQIAPCGGGDVRTFFKVIDFVDLIFDIFIEDWGEG